MSDEEEEMFPIEIAQNILRQLQESTGHRIAGFIITMWDQDNVPGRFGLVIAGDETYEMDRELVDSTLAAISRHFIEDQHE
jgi:hypothetical protein